MNVFVSVCACSTEAVHTKGYGWLVVAVGFFNVCLVWLVCSVVVLHCTPFRLSSLCIRQFHTMLTLDGSVCMYACVYGDHWVVKIMGM